MLGVIFDREYSGSVCRVNVLPSIIFPSKVDVVPEAFCGY